MSADATGTRVRLLFVDEGSYHDEEIQVPDEILERYERLIDCLIEDPWVLKRLFVDLDRLCSARRVEGEE